MDENFVFLIGDKLKFNLFNAALFLLCCSSIYFAYINQIKSAIIGIGVVILFTMPFFLTPNKNK